MNVWLGESLGELSSMTFHATACSSISSAEILYARHPSGEVTLAGGMPEAEYPDGSSSNSQTSLITIIVIFCVISNPDGRDIVTAVIGYLIVIHEFAA